MITVEKFRGVNIRRTLVENVISMIFRGILNNGDYLPSIRNMSARYHISRNSVVSAYKELESMGFIEGRERCCYLVVSKRQMQPEALSDSSCNENEQIKTPVGLSDAGLITLADRIIFNSHATLPPHFMRKYFSGIHRELAGNRPDNTQRLNHNLTRFVKITRGCRIDAENMLVMQSQQDALILLAHYGRKRSTQPSIVLEDPVSPAVFQLFSCLGYEIIRIGVGKEGMDVTSLPERHVDFIYTSPANQFPSGAKMSDANRKGLLQWSLRNNVLVIEEDACFMLGFGGNIIPPLCEFYPAANVIYLYSLNEFIGNSISLNLLSLPVSLIATFQQLTAVFTTPLPRAMSNLVNSFLESSYLLRYLSTTLRIRQSKYELAISGLRKLGGDIDCWGLMHSGYFSFSCGDALLPEISQAKNFIPLRLFCHASPLWHTNRYIYATGSLSISDIKMMNKTLGTWQKSKPITEFDEGE